MKKIISITLLTIMSSCFMQAQDIITQKNGQDIKAKILEVGTNEVKYKLFDEPNGATYTVKKSSLVMIKYESGRNEIFNTTSGLYYTDREPIQNLTPGMKYKDLKKIYNYTDFTATLSDRYSPAWSGVASFFIPGLGQMICGEVGRGFLFLGGAIGGSILGSALISSGTTIQNGKSVSVSTGSNIAGLVVYAGVLALDIIAIVDGVRVAKVKNMYEQDLKKAYAFDMKITPSFDYALVGNTYQPTARIKLAVKF